MKKIIINEKKITINDVLKVSNNNYKVYLAEEVKNKIKQSRLKVNKVLNSEKAVYGINTGFGELACVKVNDLELLQENLIRSHSVGLGDYFDEEIVRAIIFLRAFSLSRGYSGVRLILIEKLLELLNKNIYPRIPIYGSVGASGDLAPLSHLALTLIGEGECIVDGKICETKDVFKNNKIEPISLEAKEGLGLINGTQMMSAISVNVLSRAQNLLLNAVICSAMCVETLMGTDKAFDEKIHKIRPHSGQLKVAKLLRNILKDSKNVKSHRACSKVQDAYTLRCVPQILGPVFDTINFVQKIVETEINSVTDNPLVFENEILSGGNFHGEYLALSMDYIKIAISELGSHSERMTERLVNPHLSGLPAFLIKDSGLNSGLMIAQYTAAALVSENKTLSHPASVDSIPTSANQEDHVSMGSIAARNAMQVVSNVEKIVGINLLVSSQAIDFLFQEVSPIISNIHKKIRENISFIQKDRALYKDIEKAIKIVKSNLLLEYI